jgi:hypothetical protein
MDAQSPYRREPPLEDLIPPDRRRRAAIVLAAASVAAGVLWLRFAEDVRALFRESHPILVSAPRETPRRIEPVTLYGPNHSIELPAPVGAIVNVWLQGCSDCMPAFEAWAAVTASRGPQWPSVDVVNVAYGRADEGWAKGYRVDMNLVFDPTGSALVKPLGIGSFTTLVVDSDGAILLVDRPDRPGFAERVDAAVARIKRRPHFIPSGGPEPPIDPTAFNRTAAVASLGAVNVASCKTADGPTGSGHVSITFSPDGSAVSAVVDQPPFAGTPVGACIAKKFKSARVPAFAGGNVRVGKSFVVD